MTPSATIATAVAAAVAGFLVTSLAEYWIHRLMHWSILLGDRHLEHHRRNVGQGMMAELLDYLKSGAPLMLLPFVFSWSIGLGWFLGCFSFAVLAAYAHQLQHDCPDRCFWLAMPVHYVHHKYGMWHHNFGITVDWWDRCFGTYKPMPWQAKIAEKNLPIQPD